MGARRRRFTAHEKRFVGARQQWTCAACRELLPAAFECDHVVALWRGGDDTVDNLQGLCSACHASKTQREELERQRMAQRIRLSSASSPPLVCSRCDRVVSPYFRHVCE